MGLPGLRRLPGLRWLCQSVRRLSGLRRLRLRLLFVMGLLPPLLVFQVPPMVMIGVATAGFGRFHSAERWRKLAGALMWMTACGPSSRFVKRWRPSDITLLRHTENTPSAGGNVDERRRCA